MEQCADFLARMIQKYGPEILAELAEKDEKNPGNESNAAGGFYGCRQFFHTKRTKKKTSTRATRPLTKADIPDIMKGQRTV